MESAIQSKPSAWSVVKHDTGQQIHCTLVRYQRCTLVLAGVWAQYCKTRFFVVGRSCQRAMLRAMLTMKKESCMVFYFCPWVWLWCSDWWPLGRQNSAINSLCSAPVKAMLGEAIFCNLCHRFVSLLHETLSSSTFPAINHVVKPKIWFYFVKSLLQQERCETFIQGIFH